MLIENNENRRMASQGSKIVSLLLRFQSKINENRRLANQGFKIVGVNKSVIKKSMKLKAWPAIALKS